VKIIVFYVCCLVHSYAPMLMRPTSKQYILWLLQHRHRITPNYTRFLDLYAAVSIYQRRICWNRRDYITVRRTDVDDRPCDLTCIWGLPVVRMITCSTTVHCVMMNGEVCCTQQLSRRWYTRYYRALIIARTPLPLFCCEFVGQYNF